VSAWRPRDVGSGEGSVSTCSSSLVCGFRGAGGGPGHQGMASPRAAKPGDRCSIDVEAMLQGRVPANDKPARERSMHLEGIIS
jgi:hypothetical protein